MEMSTSIMFSKIINELRYLLSTYGLSKRLVTHDDRLFVSQAFSSVIKLNKAKHIKTSPCHPKSNRATARFVETLKKAMKAKLSVSLSTKLQVSYRTTLHSTANKSTANKIVNSEQCTVQA